MYKVGFKSDSAHIQNLITVVDQIQRMIQFNARNFFYKFLYMYGAIDDLYQKTCSQNRFFFMRCIRSSMVSWLFSKIRSLERMCYAYQSNNGTIHAS